MLESETRTIAQYPQDIQLAMRPALSLARLVLLAAILIWGAAAATMFGAVAGVPYPGSATTLAALHYSAWPDLTLTRAETYVTREPFDRVSTWYSKTHGLGMVEQSGVGACIRMTRGRVVWLAFEQNMTVRACATRTDSRVYLTRTARLHVPDWLRAPLNAMARSFGAVRRALSSVLEAPPK